MCMKTAIKASALCSLPGIVGFTSGAMAVYAPRIFAWSLLAGLIAACLMALRKVAAVGGSSRHTFTCEEVEIAAGGLLAIGFVVGLWSGIAYSAGFGLLRPGVIVWAGTSLLAAFCLTYVRRLITGQARLPAVLVRWGRMTTQQETSAQRHF